MRKYVQVVSGFGFVRDCLRKIKTACLPWLVRARQVFQAFLITYSPY